MNVPLHSAARWGTPLGRRLRGLVYDYPSALPSLSQVMDTVRTQLEDAPALGVLFVRLHRWGDVESLFSGSDMDAVFADLVSSAKNMLGSDLRAMDLPADLGLQGEGFAILLVGPRRRDSLVLNDVETVARRVSSGLLECFVADLDSGLTDRLSVEVGSGLVRRPGPEETFEEMLIDGLLQAEKSAEDRHDERLDELRGQLEKGLTGGTLAVFYEPVVHLDSGSIIGFDAVISGPRELNLHRSDVLLDLAHRAGLQPQVYDFCHTKAVETATGAGSPGLLFLSVSPGELVEAAIRVMALLYRYPAAGMSASNIVFMIDGSDPAGGFPDNWVACRSVEEMGFRVGLELTTALVPSLGRMRDLSPYVIRVKAGMVRNLHQRQDEFELVLMMTRFAHRHGMKMLAGDCDVQGEAAALRRLKVDFVGGEIAGPPRDQPFSEETTLL